MMCALGAAAIEAYANYTPSNTTLTFYYDNYRSSRPGMTYDLNTGSNYTDWDTDGTKSSVTKVVFNSSFANARPTTTFDWFYGMQKLQSITGMSYLNTSEVTNMSLMFQNCYLLTSLDLSHFNTSKVTDMGGMFSNSTSLTSLDLSSFNTSKVTNMGWMFNQCSNLRTIYVGNGWSTAAVTSSTNMFSDCSRLVGGQGTTYNVSNPKDKTYAHIDGGTNNPGYFTEKPTEAYACYTSSNTTLTFYYDNQRTSRSGTTYDLNTDSNHPGWETDGTNANVTKVVFNSSFANARPTSSYSWFYDMENLQSITGMNCLNTSEVTNMVAMFANCNKMTNLDLSHFNTSKVTDMTGMFDGCSGLTSLDLSSFNTSQVTGMIRMFLNSSNLRTIYVGNGWSTAAVTYSTNMFSGCTSLVGGQGTTYNASNPKDKTYAHIDGGPSNPGYFTAEGDEPWTGPEAYACFTWSNTTLTFYYDSQRSRRPGTTYDLNTGDNEPGWFTDNTCENVTKVIFEPSFADARPTSTCCWFGYMENLQSITGMSYLNTSEVTNMSFMFQNCNQLSSLDVSHFNTSKVTSMAAMFYGCNNLSSLDLSGFNTSRVANMYGMFYDCSSLRSLDVSSFNTCNVTTMGYMFGCCNNLSSLDLSGFNTSNVTSMGYMFECCDGLSSLDLSSFNTSQVTNMSSMFTNIINLQTIYVGNGWSTVAVTYSDDMFYNCTSLVGGQGTTYNPSCVDKTYAHIDGGTSNPGYFTDINAPRAYACYTPSNSTLTFYYDTQRSSRPGTIYDLNSGSPGWYNDGTFLAVTQAVFDPSFADARPTSTYYWFHDMENLRSITGMSYLNTSEVTHMGSMFSGCNQLTSIDVSHFYTANVINMYYMFSGCSSLRNLDVSHFITSQVINMMGMFAGCSSLTSLDLGSFSTSQVTSMYAMFYGCSNLTSLDLSSFRTSKVTDMENMFDACSNLRTIYVGDGWSTAAVTYSTDMFNGCTSLVGGLGTTYNSSNPTDKTYAHIDGGPSNPGYFTEEVDFLRGDVNGDGSVNISDVTALIDYLLTGNASGINLSNADSNTDGNVNISDVTALIDYLLTGVWN